MRRHNAWHHAFCRWYYADQAGHHLRARFWSGLSRALAALR